MLPSLGSNVWYFIHAQDKVVKPVSPSRFLGWVSNFTGEDTVDYGLGIAAPAQDDD